MGQDGGEQAGSDPQEQNPQEISSQDDGTRPGEQAAELFQQETNSSTTENYEANREDRVQKPPGWFKEQHPVPPAGDSNRQHLYAHNPSISDDEFAETLHEFNKSITNAATGERDSLATHQRPCTPPIERARRQVQSLEEQGVQFTEDLEKEIIDNMIHNMGLVPALTEWCGNEADIPVQYANELLKEIDRLKLEMAKQQRYLHGKLSSQMKSIEYYHKKELNEKADASDKLEGLDDNSIPSSEPSFEIPRTPPGTEGLTPASSRSTLTEARESKSLQQQVSDLQQKLDKARKDNERLQESNGSFSDKDSTNSRPEKDDKINKLEKENEGLKAKLEGRMKEMNELRQKIAKLQQIEDHQDQSDEMEASDTEPEISSSKEIKDLKEKLEEKIQDQRKEVGKNEVLTRRIAYLQINARHFDRQAQLRRNRLEELEASKTESLKSSAEKIKGLEEKIKDLDEENKDLDEQNDDLREKNEDLEKKNGDLEEKLKEKTQDHKRGTDKNEALTRRIAELQINARYFDRQAQAQRNRLEELERVNFTTADRLVEAIGSKEEEFNGKNGMSLVDRINYLNMATFLRTCNYTQLAIRENSLPMANLLLNDAEKWLYFCQEDLAKMEPSVKNQMQASMHILNGARKAMIPRNQEITRAGRESAQRGLDDLEKYPKGPAFDQLRGLAQTVIKRTSDEKPFYKRGLLGRKIAKHQIRNDASMKASQLHRAGLHSPLSPSKWDTNNLDGDIPIEKIDQGN